MADKCPQCGAPMENGKCGYCGYTDSSYSQPVQGSQVTSRSYVPPQQVTVNVNHNNDFTYGVSKKSKGVALLLCIFLGWCGAHKFYVGRIGSGLVYLFTYGVFGIGWIVDIIRILLGHFKDKYGLALQE